MREKSPGDERTGEEDRLLLGHLGAITGTQAQPQDDLPEGGDLGHAQR